MRSTDILPRQCPGCTVVMTNDESIINGWTLQETEETHVDELMTWFVDAEDINIWGGPSFRYPFSRDSFFEDLHWGQMASFNLCSPSGSFVAFGQLYERFGCINLARLVVHPARRRQGVGQRLIKLLMRKGPVLFSVDRFSLFVYRENIPAYECYKSLGFVVTEYPEGMPYADVCYYLTRPVRPHT